MSFHLFVSVSFNSDLESSAWLSPCHKVYSKYFIIFDATVNEIALIFFIIQFYCIEMQLIFVY